MKAKVGWPEFYMYLDVTLDGEKADRVTEADEEGGFIVRYQMVDGKLVLARDDFAATETLSGVVAISLVPDAPEWARQQYEHIRAAEVKS